MSWPMMRWRRSCDRRLVADRMVPSGSLKWIVCLPHGEILLFRIIISERYAQGFT